eukprot:Rmarinus@m.22221
MSGDPNDSRSPMKNISRGRFVEKSGDLFSAAESDPGVCLAHCISEDIRMETGIAKLFKDKFGGVSELHQQNPKVGGTLSLLRKQRRIYCLVTKAKCRDKLNYADFDAALLSLRRRCEAHRVRRLAMPRIGCGLNGLDWDKVRTRIQEVFSGSDVNITIYTPLLRSEERQVKTTQGSFVEKEGDLFAATEPDADVALAHCISRDVRMGKGIAKTFKDKYSGVQELHGQNPKIGDTLFLRRKQRWIYYMVTKAKYSDKPEYADFVSALRSLRRRCEADGVSKLAMPRIGCGLDGLEWSEVRSHIKDVFRGADIDITVYTPRQGLKRLLNEANSASKSKFRKR